MEAFEIDRKQLLLGIVFLLMGTMVYLVDRPVGSTHFLHEYESIQIFFHKLPALYGRLGMFAPEFFHPLALSLVSAALILDGRSKTAVCFAWFGIDAVFEAGQNFGVELKANLPERFVSLPVIRDFIDFFARGTFDPYDLAAIGLGSLAALCIIRFSPRKGEKGEREH